MTKVPMLADGGELTTLRELASDVYGRERVDWPEQMPDEVKPKIDDDHEFGYLYRLNQQVGRMGRRWVRADVSILAADFEDGKRTPIPGSGFSDFEAVLDEASARVSGEALFQKEITRSGLGPLVPFRDFTVGDVWPVLVWDLLILDVVVSRIEATSEVGAATDWRVLMGNELVSDYAAQQRANESAARAVEQSRRQARAEARREAEEARRAAEKAVRDQRTYIDGSFRTSVLSSAKTTAGELAGTAERNAKTYAKRDLWLYGEPGYALQKQFEAYQADLAVISSKMGGTVNVQNAFANELWRQDALIREMQSKGIPVERQANAFAQYNAINTALWQNQKNLDDAQTNRLPVFGTFSGSSSSIYDFGFSDVILEVSLRGSTVSLRGYRGRYGTYSWSYKMSFVFWLQPSLEPGYAEFTTRYLVSENSSASFSMSAPVKGGFVIIGRRS